MSEDNSTLATFTTQGSVKRLRFTSDDDLALLRDFVSLNPLEEVEKWEDIQKNLFAITGKKFSIRTLKDHLFHILEIWVKKDKTTQIMSGIEEIYSERDQLLQEVSDMCNKAKIKPVFKKRKLSKEKQIAELGKQAREECSINLIENDNIQNLPPILADHHYSNTMVDSEMESSNIDQCIDPLIPLEMEPNVNTVFLGPLVSEAEKDVALFQTPSKQSTPKTNLGPKKTKNNKSGTLRRTALEYLQNKESREEIIKMRQLDLEQEKLTLEKRRLLLEEKRQEMEFAENKEKLEMEKTRFKQEMFERDQNSKIIEQQHQLIQSLIARLNKYEGK